MINDVIMLKRRNLISCFSLVAATMFWSNINSLQAQPIPADSMTITPAPGGYYEMFQDRLTWRVLGSRKYVSLDAIPKGDNIPKTKWRPTAPLNTGIGGTYKFLTINVVYGFKPLNPKRFDIGKTKFLDAQSHILLRKANIEFYGQLYKGFYSENLNNRPKDFFREDIGALVFSLTYERVLNWKKYSMRAVVNQSERQLKSAGTPLLGWGLHIVRYKGDSSFAFNNGPASTYNLDRLVTVVTGPVAGYAYTLAIARRAYLMAGLTGQLGMHMTTEELGSNKDNHFAVRANALFRTGAGYTGNRWGATLQWQGWLFDGSNPDVVYRYGSGRVLGTINYNLQVKRKNFVFKTIDNVSELLKKK